MHSTNDKKQIEIDLLKTIVKQLEQRIKEVDNDRKNAYYQYQIDNYTAIKNELINQKIKLEKWSKKLKYEILESTPK